MLLWLLCTELFVAVRSVAASYRVNSPTSPAEREPCLFPVPFTPEYDIFCQLNYHKTTYMCDPTGVLSRTEIDLLDASVKELNMSSCFCGVSCQGSATNSLGVVVVANATLNSLESCDSSLHFSRPSSLPSTAYQIGLLLHRHYAAYNCDADLMLIYIRIWVSDRVVKPFIVPIYSNSLERLQRYSHPLAVSPRESVLSALTGGLRNSHRLAQAEWTEVRSTIPRWAKWLAAGLVSFVLLLIYIANCVTNKLGKASQKQKSSVTSVRKASDRFRTGFGGGMIMNSSTQQKKSVMMFRTFSKTPRNGNINRI